MSHVAIGLGKAGHTALVCACCYHVFLCIYPLKKLIFDQMLHLINDACKKAVLKCHSYIYCYLYVLVDF